METYCGLYAHFVPRPGRIRMSSNKKLDPIMMDEVMGINAGRNTPRLYAPKPVAKIIERVRPQDLRHRQDHCGQE